MKDVLTKLVGTTFITENDLIALLEDDAINSELFRLADDIRKKNVGDAVHLRALIEFSNICSCNCKYCGLRCGNKNLERYRLDADAIVSLANSAKELGFKTVVLQSGEDLSFSTDKLVEIIERIKKLDLAITLSIGEKTFEEYQAYKNAGADRYLLRIETTDEALYEKMHPNMSLTNRKRCLEDLKKLGYEVGSGILIGLPNQSFSSIAKDLLYLQNIDIDMAGIGPFIPNPDTPLANASGGSFNLSLKVMALMRLMLPKINIPATTAMEALNPEGRIIALQSGANVVMPNVTECGYREKYLIYPGKVAIDKTAQETYNSVKEKIESINRQISTDYGISKNFKG